MVALVEQNSPRADASPQNDAPLSQASTATMPRDTVQAALAERRQSLLTNMSTRDDDIERVISQAGKLASGQERQLAADLKTVDETNDLLGRMYGSHGVALEQVANDQKHIEEKRELLADRIKLRAEEQQLHAEERKAIEEAQKLAGSNPDQAEKLLENAERLDKLIADRAAGKGAIDVDKEKASMAELRQEGEKLSAISSHLGTTITIAETTRTVANTTVVIGATMIGGTAAGAAVNAGLKTAENAAEGAMDVAVGNKTAEQALSKFGSQEVSVGIETAMLLAAGGAGKIGGAFVKEGATVATKMTVGAISGSALNVGGTLVGSAWQMHEAHEAFLAKNPNLSGAELDKAWTQYRADNGLSTLAIAEKTGIALVTGAAAGGFGSVTSGGLGGRITNFAINGGAGVAQQGFSGPMTAEGVFQAVAWGTTGLKGEHGVPIETEVAPVQVRTPEIEAFHQIGSRIGENISSDVTASIDAHLSPDMVQVAGREAGSTTVEAIRTKALTNGPESVTADFVRDTSASAVKEQTADLLRVAKVPELVEAETTKFLEKVSTGKVKDLAEEFGVPEETVKGMKKLLRDQANDGALKDALVENITDTLHEPVRERLLDKGFKDEFMETLDQGTREVNDELEAAGKQRIDEEMVKHAADEGFEKGLKEGLEEVVREGVEESFDKFRNRRSQHSGASGNDGMITPELKIDAPRDIERYSAALERLKPKAVETHGAKLDEDGVWRGW